MNVFNFYVYCYGELSFPILILVDAVIRRTLGLLTTIDFAVLLYLALHTDA